MSPPLPTDFAPAERSDQQEIESIAQELLANPLINVFNAVPVPLIIINNDRQTVFCNMIFQHTSIYDTPHNILGLRPGEALGCIHSNAHEGGCGTSKFCRECGAASAIIKSLDGASSTDECRILRNINHEEQALNLQVFTSPFKYHNHDFILFTAIDISHEKRKQNLEHLFYHDVLNLVTGLKYTAQMVCKNTVTDKAAEKCITMNRTISHIAEEIQAQKALSQAEEGRLPVHPRITSTGAVLSRLKEIYLSQELCEGISIEISEQSINTDIETDPVILSRILGNMIKNALEASKSMEKVTLGAEKEDDRILLWVHNESVIPEKVQRQIFKRSFSTKGQGRGLGTYSMKLLAENFLNGSITFESGKETGTVFTVSLPEDGLR